MGRSKQFALVAILGTAMTLPVVAHPTTTDRPGSSFAIVGQSIADTALRTAKSGGTLIELQARPVTAVRLEEGIQPETAALFGAKPEAPFDAGRVLTGWPERPGLYCDFLRNRGLGLSTACLYDRDGDGRFDEGRRYDFNSGIGDLLGLTPSGKIIGVRTTAKKPALVALTPPASFSKVEVPGGMTGRLALKWRKIKSGGQQALQLWITTPDNYTGTEGISAEVAQVQSSELPDEGELYGVRLRLLGFDEKGALRYQILGVRDGATVPLMFRGYTFRIIMI